MLQGAAVRANLDRLPVHGGCWCYWLCAMCAVWYMCAGYCSAATCAAPGQCGFLFSRTSLRQDKLNTGFFLFFEICILSFPHLSF